MKNELINSINIEKANNLLEGFYKTFGFITAVLGLKGNILSKSGWRQIYIEFHRVHPETSGKCTISDTELAGKLAEGEKYHFYKCLNGFADNFSILEATDGVKCIEVARNHPLNFVLMDIALPEMDGIEAFKILRKLPNLQHIPIIALTASAMTSDRETILAYGFDAYIAKPIDEHIFFKTINETLYGK